MKTQSIRQCPTCRSKAPHLHPAVQSEGEVEVCADEFHLQPTPQNSSAFTKLVVEKRLRQNRELYPLYGVYNH